MAIEAPTTGAAPAATFDPAVWLRHFEAVGGGYSATDTQTSLCIAYHGATLEDQQAANALVAQLSDDERGRVVALVRLRSGVDLASQKEQPNLKLNSSALISEEAPIGREPTSSPAGDEPEGSNGMNMLSALGTDSDLNLTVGADEWQNVCENLRVSPDIAGAANERTLRDKVSAWRAVVRRYEASEAAVRNHPFGDALPTDPNYKELEVANNDACAENANAYRAMLAFPAPNIAAARYKLKATAEAYEIDDELAEPILRDLDRFAIAAGTDPIFQRAVSAYRAAKTASMTYWHEVENPAEEACSAAKLAVPHKTTVSTYERKSGEVRGLSTSDDVVVASMRSFLEKRPYEGGDDFEACARELVQLADERWAQIREIDKAPHIKAIRAEGERLGEIVWQALNEVSGYPVRSLADMITKIETLDAGGDLELCTDDLLGDLRRIDGRALT